MFSESSRGYISWAIWPSGRGDGEEASVAAQRDMEAQAAAVPVKVRSFMEDFRDMEVPQAKAVLQSIIKAAHVFKDGRIELEFRS